MPSHTGNATQHIAVQLISSHEINFDTIMKTKAIAYRHSLLSCASKINKVYRAVDINERVYLPPWTRPA